MNIKLLIEFFLLFTAIFSPIYIAMFFIWRYSVRGIVYLNKKLKARLTGLGEK